MVVVPPPTQDASYALAIVETHAASMLSSIVNNRRLKVEGWLPRIVVENEGMGAAYEGQKF